MTAHTAPAGRVYDLIVVGAGPVGENVADYAHRRGLSVAIVEQELVGGECSYWACMPSKALLRGGSALAAARRVDGARQAVTDGPDPSATLRRRDAFVSGWSDSGQVEWLASAGVERIRGHGRLAGVREVEVDGVRYEARGAVALATGSVPRLPDIPGLAQARPWSTRDATGARSIPESLAIIGGGVAAVELATAYARLGSRVTVIARSGLLERFEPVAAEEITRALGELEVDLRLQASPTRVDRLQDGSVRVGLDSGAEVEAAEVLVATGRVPRTQDLGLEAVGLDPDRQLVVDDTMRVRDTDWLYAVGDVNGRAPLTHQGKYEARAAGEAIAARRLGRLVDENPWGAHAATADHAAVPQVVFTDPEVASVGLTERQARDRGLRVRAVEYDLGAVAGSALHADGYRGRAKAIVDEDRGVLVGVTLVGQDVAELLHAASIAVVGEVPLARLWHAVPAYPTMSEVWLRLLEEYGRP